MGHCVQNFLIASKASFTMDRNKYWLIGLLVITSSSLGKGCLLIQSSFLYWQTSMQNWSAGDTAAAVGFGSFVLSLNLEHFLIVTGAS